MQLKIDYHILCFLYLFCVFCWAAWHMSPRKLYRCKENWGWFSPLFPAFCLNFSVWASNSLHVSKTITEETTPGCSCSHWKKYQCPCWHQKGWSPELCPPQSQMAFAVEQAKRKKNGHLGWKCRCILLQENIVKTRSCRSMGPLKFLPVIVPRIALEFDLRPPFPEQRWLRVFFPYLSVMLLFPRTSMTSLRSTRSPAWSWWRSMWSLWKRGRRSSRTTPSSWGEPRLGLVSSASF